MNRGKEGFGERIELWYWGGEWALLYPLPKNSICVESTYRASSFRVPESARGPCSFGFSSFDSPECHVSPKVTFTKFYHLIGGIRLAAISIHSLSPLIAQQALPMAEFNTSSNTELHIKQVKWKQREEGGCQLQSYKKWAPGISKWSTPLVKSCLNGSGL